MCTGTRGHNLFGTVNAMFVCSSFVLSSPFIAQNIFYRRRRSIRGNTNVIKGGNVCIWKLCTSMRWSGLKRCVLQLRVKKALCELSPTSRWSLQMGFAIFSHTWDFRSFTDMLRIGTVQISRSWQGQHTTHLLLWKHILLRYKQSLWNRKSSTNIERKFFHIGRHFCHVVLIMFFHYFNMIHESLFHLNFFFFCILKQLAIFWKLPFKLFLFIVIQLVVEQIPPLLHMQWLWFC